MRRTYGFWLWANTTSGALAASVLGVVFAVLDGTYELLLAIPCLALLVLFRPTNWRQRLMDLFS